MLSIPACVGLDTYQVRVTSNPGIGNVFGEKDACDAALDLYHFTFIDAGLDADMGFRAQGGGSAGR